MCARGSERGPSPLHRSGRLRDRPDAIAKRRDRLAELLLVRRSVIDDDDSAVICRRRVRLWHAAMALRDAEGGDSRAEGQV